MTPDAQILIQAPPGSGGFRADQITISWRPQVPSTPPNAAERLDSQWRLCRKEFAARGAALFNGPITQLLEARLDGADRIHLTLAPADFKTFLITCTRDRDWFQQNAPQSIARALGNSALLSNGHHALLGMRSETVSAYPRRAHLIGGVLDPLNTSKFPANAQGLIAHLLLELAEEASLSPQHLAPPPDSPRLLAIAQDPHLGQPEAIWSWPTRIPLEQIHLTPTEHAAALILFRAPLPAETGAILTPIARLAFDLWSRGELIPEH